MKKFEVRFRVDGKDGGAIIVEAKDPGMARKVALGELQGRAGYAGKRISISGAREIK